MQIDTPERGFSFMKDGPLDMRMDDTSDLTAEFLVNKASEKELVRIFRDLGEEPRWKRAVATLLIARRKKRIQTTFELLEALDPLMHTKIRGRLHPATLIFQGLRLAVNRELEVLEEVLQEAIDHLAEGGTIGVISFHRLEDRIVKEVFRRNAKEGKLVLLAKKPITPSLREMRRNPRSRSAKLRLGGAPCET